MALRKANALDRMTISTISSSDEFVVRDSGTGAGLIAARRITFGELDGRWQELPGLGTAGEMLRVNSLENALEYFHPPAAGSSTFIGLSDTPAALGSVGQSIRVATGGTALEFYTPTSGGASTFLGLTDTPVNYTSATAGQVVALNATKDALVFEDKGSGGVSTFIGLQETPSSLGTAGQGLAMNAAETALEWVTLADTTGGLDWRN